MLNEFTYCPRLFFLEWVEGRFVDSDDTVEGRLYHRPVDQPQGSLPPPDASDLRIARSVTLSSPRLGVIARIDLLELSDGAVQPVDYKHGHPPGVEGKAWEPERVQLCVQGLLLREAGYRCDQGALYFPESRRRVLVEFTDELIARTLSLIAEARAVAAEEHAPPPLVDSPKCPRCSLVGLCLPDETNLLLLRREMPPRRLITRDPPARALYVMEQGAVISKDGNRLTIRKEKEQLESVRLIDVAQVCVFGQVQVTTAALQALFAVDVPVCWFSYGGRFLGMATGLPGKNVELRRRQVAVASQGYLPIARRFVVSKIRNCRTLLRRNRRFELPATLSALARAAEEAGRAASLDSLRGIEGAAARSYFGAFPAMLRDAMGVTDIFAGRNRRPPRDPVNALLSFLYSLLVKDLAVQAHVVGFDPYLGFLHRPRFGRPALALDVAEEFRPLVADSVAVGLLNNGELTTRDFVGRNGEVALTPDGRRKVLRAYERRLEVEVRHPVFDYRTSYRRVYDLQLRILAAHVLGEVPEYRGFETR
jgi:CRISPR-associated protein Cas1